MKSNRLLILCLTILILISSNSVYAVSSTNIMNPLKQRFQKEMIEALKTILNQKAQQIEIEPEIVEKEINFMLIGDVCLATNFGSRNRFHTLYDNEGPEYFFQHMKPYFEKADYVLANLENVFTNETDYQKGKIWTYKADAKYVDVIYKSGITHVAVVNNHMQDYLKQGFDESVKLLEEGGIRWFGTNEYKTHNIELGNIFVDKKEVVDKDGFRVGLLSYYGFNTSFATDNMIDRDVKHLKEVENVDYIICYVHWGGQGTYNIEQRQKDYGRKLVDKGVDLVVGGHPHVVQTMEVYNGKHIYYSLGDFMFVHRSTPKDPDSIMIDLKLIKDKDGNITEHFEYIPVLWGGSSTSNQFTPKVGTEQEIQRALKKLDVK